MNPSKGNYESQLEPPEWFDIVPDKFKCACEYCSRHGKTKDFVYIERNNGLTPIIVHRKCVGEDWLERTKKGEPAKARTVARIWHARGWPPKLRLAKKKKIDFAIPKEMKPKKKK